MKYFKMFLIHIEPSSYGSNCKYNHGLKYNEFVLLKQVEFDVINLFVEKLKRENRGMTEDITYTTKTHNCILEFDLVDLWESAIIIQAKTPSENYREIMNIKKFNDSNFKILLYS